MLVSEFIKELQKYDPNSILLSMDTEVGEYFEVAGPPYKILMVEIKVTPNPSNPVTAAPSSFMIPKQELIIWESDSRMKYEIVREFEAVSL